jgi:hypothetical protein
LYFVVPMLSSASPSATTNKNSHHNSDSESPSSTTASPFPPEPALIPDSAQVRPQQPSVEDEHLAISATSLCPQKKSSAKEFFFELFEPSAINSQSPSLPVDPHTFHDVCSDDSSSLRPLISRPEADFVISEMDSADSPPLESMLTTPFDKVVSAASASIGTSTLKDFHDLPSADKERLRIRLFELEADSQWVDKGTGYCQILYDEVSLIDILICYI